MDVIYEGFFEDPYISYFDLDIYGKYLMGMRSFAKFLILE
jgi:hypothetical protein